ncbi:MAG: DUF3862 domain-containing protein [Thermodesulfobacteriota bacterium]
METGRSIKTVAAILLLSLALWGCREVNRENFEKLQVGMDYKEVVAIIGEPDKCDSILGMKSCIWGSESKNITVNFLVDKVVVPSMKGL